MDKVKRNFIYNILYHVVSLIIPFIVNPYITRTISQELLGRNTYICAQITYFCLFGTLGINYLGTREIAKADAEGGSRVRERFYSLFHLQLCTYLIVFAAFIVFLFFSSDYISIKLMYILMLLSCMTDISWLYMGMEKFQFISLRNCLVRILCTALVFLGVKTDNDINIYVACLYTPQLILNIMMWGYARQNLGKDSRGFRIRKDDVKRNLILAIPGIAISVYTILDKLVIGLFQPTESVAIYDQGQSLVRIVLSAISAFGTVVMPKVSGMVGKSSKEEIQSVIYRCSDFVWFLSSALVFGVLGVADIFISWYLPEDYSYVTNVIIFTSPLIMIVSAENIMGMQILIPHGGEKQYSISLVVAAVINFLLDLLLVPTYGIAAACICSVFAEGSALAIQCYYSRRYVEISGIYQTIGFYIGCGVIMYVVLRYVHRMLLFSPQVSTIVLVIVGSIIYLLLCAMHKFVRVLTRR